MNAYLFDVDGVITDPVEKKITKPELVSILTSKLENGTPCGFISGRGIDWLRTHVIEEFEKYFDEHYSSHKGMLDLLYVSGEFGGVRLLHKNSKAEIEINKDFFIPQQLIERLNKVGKQFSDFAFIEHEKQTQFTMEAKNGNDFFGLDGKKIAEALKQEIIDYSELEVIVDRIGMNVKNKKANKRYSVSLFLNWLAEKNLKPTKFYVFGDSPSDLEMGEELQNKNLNFEFIYVGDQSEFKKEDYAFPITVTEGHCDKGTLEYLVQK